MSVYQIGRDTGPFAIEPEPAPVSAEGYQSLLDQLAGLYQEKQELQDALGVSTAEEVLAHVASLQDDSSDSMVESLTLQLHSLYSDHEELRAALGCDAPEDVIALVEDLRSSVRTLVDDARRRLTIEFNLLRAHERSLA